jgi:hypothetical protein
MFRKAIAVLLLLTTPFAQARAVLICSMMDGQVVERCCCPGHAEHHMPTRHNAPDGACCDVVVQVSDKTFAGVNSDQPTLKRVAHDVQDVFVLATPAPFVPTFAVALRPPPYVDVAAHLPDRLYLRTARLRL